MTYVKFYWTDPQAKLYGFVYIAVTLKKSK